MPIRWKRTLRVRINPCRQLFLIDSAQDTLSHHVPRSFRSLYSQRCFNKCFRSNYCNYNQSVFNFPFIYCCYSYYIFQLSIVITQYFFLPSWPVKVLLTHLFGVSSRAYVGAGGAAICQPAELAKRMVPAGKQRLPRQHIRAKPQTSGPARRLNNDQIYSLRLRKLSKNFKQLW